MVADRLNMQVVVIQAEQTVRIIIIIVHFVRSIHSSFSTRSHSETEDWVEPLTGGGPTDVVERKRSVG